MPETPEIPEELPLADVTAAIAEATMSPPECEMPETAQVPETTEENEPMIDIHVPQAMHTWKEFWIHLGTITLGLLIAIGLEQSVEAMHRLHQRHQLEADLQAEGVENQTLADNDWRVMDDRMAATAARLREVESTLAGRKKIDAPFPASSFTPPPPTADGSFKLPLSAVWTTAKEGASIDLLPRESARNYTRLYLQVDQLLRFRLDAGTGENEVAAYECRFSDGTLPCKPNLSQMTEEQLGEYSGLLTRDFILMRVVKARVLTYEIMNDHMLRGRDLETAGAPQQFRAEHPDTFLRPLPKAR